jgi:hypothetical protein
MNTLTTAVAALVDLVVTLAALYVTTLDRIAGAVADMPGDVWHGLTDQPVHAGLLVAFIVTLGMALAATRMPPGDHRAGRVRARRADR